MVVFPGRLFWSNACQLNQYLLVIINVKLKPITIFFVFHNLQNADTFYIDKFRPRITMLSLKNIKTSMLHLYLLVFSFVNVGLL
jgi:hypothetical protein